MKNNDDKGKPYLAKQDYFEEKARNTYCFTDSKIPKLLNVHLKMLLSIVEAMESPKLMHFSENIQTELVKLFKDFLAE